MTYREMPSEQPILVVAMGPLLLGAAVQNGDILWEHNLGYQQGAIDLFVTGDRIYAAYGDWFLIYEYPTGVELARTKLITRYASRTSFLVDAGRIYVARGGELFALDPNGTILWVQRFEDRGTAAAALAMPGKVAQIDES